MSTDAERSKLTVEELAARFRGEMIPAHQQVLLLLYSADGRGGPAPVSQRPDRGDLPGHHCQPAARWASSLRRISKKATAKKAIGSPSSAPRSRATSAVFPPRYRGLTVLALGIKDIEVADYHYQFYNALAAVVADRWPSDIQERFFRTIREELSAEVHGEVDEKSWHLKQALLRRQTNVRKETKLFREYARQAFEDTLTLYLHGTCCDIDVETGPRQMPSRYLRRRLELLISLYPPPEGYAVLPEQLKTR